ncbi:HYR domain-containing protein [Streptomyces sp. NPDC052236]|uniref:HYR domain-containing protein n=1 Tax=Streptomyces sp. NPDC052236 TaxID=3365686 RepID=UPI0037D9909B
MRRFRLRAGLMAALLTFGGVGVGVGDAAVTAAAPSPSMVTPSVVEQSLNPGGSLTVTKQVRTPAVPPKPDVVLLVDNTGSMGEAIANVKRNLPTIVDRVFAAQPDSRFAVASYGDQREPRRLFLLHQAFTNDRAAIQRGVNALSAADGDDTPEDWGNALWEVATGAGGRNPFRSGASPIVVLVGDASSHDPSNGHPFNAIVPTLKTNNVKVLAVDVESRSDGLNGQRANFKKGQATRVTGETGGTYLQGIDANGVANAIVSGLTNLPINVTHRPVNCDPSLSVSLTPAGSQVTSGQTATFTETVTVAGNAPQGSTLTCTVQFYLGPAGADPSYQQQIRITVNDVTAPVVTVDDRTVEATGPDGAVIDYTATARDNVDGNVGVTCTPPSGSRFPIGRTTVTCTARDRAGNTGRDTAVFTVVDGTAPVVRVDDRTAEATGPDGAVITYTATAEDNIDGEVYVTCTPPSGAGFPVGRTIVTCTATDRAGNTGRDTAVFTVTDTTAPVVTVEDRTAEATGPDGAVIEYPTTAKDIVDGDVPVTCQPPSGATFPLGKTSVTCTATDKAGNTGKDTAEFTVTDTTGPVVTVEDRTAEATGPDGIVVEYPASAVDAVDGEVPVTCEPPSGSRFPLGETTVTCTATDKQGNTGRDTAVIKVVDTTAPVVTVEDRTAEATGPDGAVIEYTATAVDTVDGPVSVTCEPVSGFRFPIGKTTVTCTATDKAGNTGRDTAVFTVVDTTAPVVTVEDRTAEATGPDGAVIEYTATAVDTVDGPVSVTCEPVSGFRFPIGKTTVTCTATDKAGNTGRDTAVFTVVDTTAPVVTVDDRTAKATGHDGATIDYTATAVDGIDGPLPVICTPLSGSTFPVGKTTVTCTATDKAGNTGTDTAVFTVIDVGAPVVRVDDRTVEITGGTSAVIRYAAFARDLIDGIVSVTCAPRSGSSFPLGRTTVTCTARDKAGNTGKDTAVFTVVLRPPTPRPPAADLAVTAAATPLPAFTGGEITTTFTLTNAGPDTATGIVLAATVPQPVRVLNAQSGCTSAARCTLPAGGRIEVTARISYEKATTGALSARVTGATQDPRTANNTATLQIRVLQPVLTAGPLVARLGDVVLAEGRDFPAGTIVKLEWSEGITAATTPVRVRADGTFRTQMLVLRKDKTGPRLLGASGPGYNPLDTGILVVPRSLQPPKFAGRG